MKNRLRSEWPLAAALALWLIYLGGQLLAMRGSVSYASDDAYLRLAVGRNLALNGTWGIHPGQFASMVGSLLWPLVLGVADKLIGIHTGTPLLINIVLSFFLLAALERAARRAISEPWLRFAAVILAAVALPLGPLVLEGMEHTLQLLLTLFFVEGILPGIDLDRPDGNWIGLAVVAAVLTITRYEGLFVVVMAALILSLASRRNLPLAILLLLAGVLPLAVYGWFSYRGGWLPVPNDVYFRRAPLIPDSLDGVWSILLRPLDLLNQDAALRAITLAPLVAIFWRAVIRKQESTSTQNLARAFLFCGVVLLHLLFVGLREYRYDAYLILLGWWAVLPWIQEILDFFRSQKPALLSVSCTAFGILAVLLLFPLANRGVTETAGWWQARGSFRQNQMQAVAMLKEASFTTGVATDFPGIFSYSGFPVIDLTGMGSASLARARRSGGIHAEDVARELAVTRISTAAVLDPSVRRYLPEDWIQTAAIQGSGYGSNEIVIYQIPNAR